jgi:hypothetical protein
MYVEAKCGEAGKHCLKWEDCRFREILGIYCEIHTKDRDVL